MGGRGATSSLGRGGVAIKSITTQGGKTIDLSDNPLVYGKNDSSLTGAKRKKMKN